MSVETQAKRDGPEAYDKAIWDQKTENVCTISEDLILVAIWIFQRLG